MTKPTDPHDPASPCPDAGRELHHAAAAYMGLSKRELFAAMAMQGMLTSSPIDEYMSETFIPELAVDMADSLIAALEIAASPAKP